MVFVVRTPLLEGGTLGVLVVVGGGGGGVGGWSRGGAVVLIVTAPTSELATAGLFRQMAGTC